MTWHARVAHARTSPFAIVDGVARDVGVFVRAMYSDGRTEVYAFTSADRSLAFGTLARGSLWKRPRDYVGVASGIGWISKPHARYLALGGVDAFVGDGRLRKAPEAVFEIFYGLNVTSSIWFSADFQIVANPAFNADRGPVNVFGARAHAEF